MRYRLLMRYSFVIPAILLTATAVQPPHETSVGQAVTGFSNRKRPFNGTEGDFLPLATAVHGGLTLSVLSCLAIDNNTLIVTCRFQLSADSNWSFREIDQVLCRYYDFRGSYVDAQSVWLEFDWNFCHVCPANSIQVIQIHPPRGAVAFDIVCGDLRTPLIGFAGAN
jgi:hypothetical protein